MSVKLKRYKQYSVSIHKNTVMKNKALPLIIIAIAIIIVGYSFAANRKNSEEITSNDPLITESENSSAIKTGEETKVDSATKTATVKKPASASGKFIDNKVPFTSQAPTGNWDDERQQDGCEEASALMAVYWAEGKTLNSSIALKEILGASDYELKAHGEFRDISVDDVVAWTFKEYFKYSKAVVMRNVTIADMVAELEKGNVIVAPMNGQKLGNPYFTAPGPERHMLLIRGYDPAKKQFITNDPGTKRGAGYRYNETVLYNALLAYPTGYHETISGTPKHIIIVSK